MKAPHRVDPQQLIITLLAVKYLQEHGGQVVILYPKELQELAKFTVRLEIVEPNQPETSPIKCTAISVADAIKLMEEVSKARGKV